MFATSALVIMPVLGARDLTIAAISDVLNQTVRPFLLIVDQGVDLDFARELQRIAEEEPAARIFIWRHDPPLPSLSASWNRALQFAWDVGCSDALVVNNDVRLHRMTYEHLRAVQQANDAYFVSAVGVTERQYEDAIDSEYFEASLRHDPIQRGGPDFSCFLISRAGHDAYPFDEGFVPAYCEDLDMHRRYMLGGDGDKIFSINLPYLHVGGGSGTLKSFTPEQRAAHERKIGQSRAYYEAKWGGPVNHEQFTIPFDAGTAQPGVTTPDLQRALQPLKETQADGTPWTEEAVNALELSWELSWPPIPRDA